MNGCVFLVLRIKLGVEYSIIYFIQEQDTYDYVAQYNVNEPRHSRLTYREIAIYQ